jgi:hypothetical protein
MEMQEKRISMSMQILSWMEKDDDDGKSRSDKMHFNHS